MNLRFSDSMKYMLVLSWLVWHGVLVRCHILFHFAVISIDYFNHFHWHLVFYVTVMISIAFVILVNVKVIFCFLYIMRCILIFVFSLFLLFL